VKKGEKSMNINMGVRLLFNVRGLSLLFAHPSLMLKPVEIDKKLQDCPRPRKGENDLQPKDTTCVSFTTPIYPAGGGGGSKVRDCQKKLTRLAFNCVLGFRLIYCLTECMYTSSEDFQTLLPLTPSPVKLHGG